MPNGNGEPSIFDVLSPPPEPGGIRGALGGGLRGISDFFREATPAILQEEEAGFGEAFAGGLLGALGEPSRQAERRERARRETALNFVTHTFDALTPETQEQVAGALGLEGLEFEREPSFAQRQLLQANARLIADPNTTSSQKESAFENIRQVSGEFEDIKLQFGFEGVPDFPSALLSTFAREYTPESIERFVNPDSSDFRNWATLERLPASQRGGGKVSLNDRLFEQVFRKITAYQARNPQASIDEAAEAVELDRQERAIIDKTFGVSVGGEGYTTRDILENALRFAGQNIPLQLALATGQEGATEQLENITLAFTDLSKRLAEQLGIPIQGLEIGPRRPEFRPDASPPASPEAIEARLNQLNDDAFNQVVSRAKEIQVGSPGITDMQALEQALNEREE